MHVAHVGFFLDPQRRTPDRILEDWWPLVDCAEMVVRAGARVSVVQACHQPLTMMHREVVYHFAAPESLGRVLGGLRADLFHVHGLNFPNDVLALSDRVDGRPILIQDHANKLPRPWRRGRHRRALATAAAVAFCAAEQSRPLREAGLLQEQTRVFEIPECSSRFTPGDRHEARQLAEIHGDPAVLWVGHLDRNKDPLTVLEGVAQAVDSLPNLHLWCCYGTAPLLDIVTRRISDDPRLAGRVHLLGRRPHAAIETLMRAADIFVLGSHREGSGCSVIEAMACGLPPVVSDIPSFRALTGGGRAGALWRRADPSALRAALLSVANRAAASRVDVRSHFEREISFDAVGGKLMSAYAQMLGNP